MEEVESGAPLIIVDSPSLLAHFTVAKKMVHRDLLSGIIIIYDSPYAIPCQSIDQVHVHQCEDLISSNIIG